MSESDFGKLVRFKDDSIISVNWTHEFGIFEYLEVENFDRFQFRIRFNYILKFGNLPNLANMSLSTKTAIVP